MSSIDLVRRAGMGAIPHEAGVTFRVWAPHADRVSVVGSFNDWKTDTHVLEPEADGYFALDVPEAKIGRRIPLRDSQRRTGAFAHRSLRARGHELGRQRHRPRPDVRLGRRRLQHRRRTTNWSSTRCTSARSAARSREKPPARSTMRSAGSDHLKRLGVNAVEVMPIAEFAGDCVVGLQPGAPISPIEAGLRRAGRHSSGSSRRRTNGVSR